MRVLSVARAQAPATDAPGTGGADLDGGVTVAKTVTILRSIDDVFDAFSGLALVPRFMSHVQSVTPSGPGRWRWAAVASGDQALEWETDVVEERPARVAWEAVAGGEVRAVGSAEFRPAPPGRGTEVQVRLSYAPPLGKPGQAVLKLLGEEPKQQLTRDLYRLRQLLEAGVIATTEGQASGREEP
jgi:uncharacterized membrane protein